MPKKKGGFTKRELKQLDENMMTARIDSFRVLYEHTKNPLYVWEGIIYSIHYERGIPGWCLPYIEHVAGQIHDLIAKASTWAYSGQYLKLPFKPAMAVDEAGNAIAGALGIVRQGYNAFQQVAADQNKIDDAHTVEVAEVFEQLAGRPETREGAIERVRIRRCLNSTRVVERRVREGKALQSRLKSTKPTI